MARIVTIDGQGPHDLAGWEVAEAPAGAAPTDPGLRWIPARVPGTVGDALRAADGAFSLDRPRDLDAATFFFRCRFATPSLGSGEAVFLRLDGLATLTEVDLNGAPLLRSESMFVPHRVEITNRLLPDAPNELVIRCLPLRAALDARRPRPRWRPRLVAHQNLRWFRTTLLGRMPGWCPEIAPVGPWRPVQLERRVRFDVENAQVVADYAPADEGGAGEGQLTVRAVLRPLTSDEAPERAVLSCAGHTVALELSAVGAGDARRLRLAGLLRAPNVAAWWPHTHGTPVLHDAHITLFGPAERWQQTLTLDRVGFRRITLDTSEGRFGLAINGVPVFCRGAVWSTPDIVSLGTTSAGYARAVAQARAAGMNMLRVGGTMAYEQDAFHAACDEQGVLVWQDLMFANFDYPDSDAGFRATVEAEVRGLLQRIGHRPSLALVCGNSEVEQQAAMLGLPRTAWRHELFDAFIPALVKDEAPGLPYWPSSPASTPAASPIAEGVMPFAPHRGLAHYYGVGAYQRPIEDARRAAVTFASECLAFANVPEPATVESLMGANQTPPHHPRWKSRVPRDPGAGWDFEDTRDHYVTRLLGEDAAAVRLSDPERYLAMGRIASGEAMAGAFAEWRRRGSVTQGALVWMFQDVWPGAGWGVVDAFGRPKAAYYYLRRALAPFAVLLTDEGSNGLVAHAINDSSEDAEAELEIAIYRHGRERVDYAQHLFRLPARQVTEILVDGLLEAFRDTTWSYRFGPPAHDAICATLRDRTRHLVPSSSWYFPVSRPLRLDPDLALTCEVRPGPDGVELRVSSNRLAYAVAVEAPGYIPEDSYVTIAPGGSHVTWLHPDPSAPREGREAMLSALNGTAPLRVRW